MRYDRPVYFQSIVDGSYNEDTGNYEDDKIEENLIYASVVETKTELMTMIYGSIKQGSLTIHIQNSYTKPFDSIRIGEKRYKVDYYRKFRTKESFVISEVQ